MHAKIRPLALQHAQPTVNNLATPPRDSPRPSFPGKGLARACSSLQRVHLRVETRMAHLHAHGTQGSGGTLSSVVVWGTMGRGRSAWAARRGLRQSCTRVRIGAARASGGFRCRGRSGRAAARPPPRRGRPARRHARAGGRGSPWPPWCRAADPGSPVVHGEVGSATQGCSLGAWGCTFSTGMRSGRSGSLGCEP